MKRMLAFFGAFNPPTVAHIELARYAQLKTNSDGVIFVPSKSAYIKDSQGKDFAFTDSERFKMLRAISKTHKWMGVTDCEIMAETQPRTYITLCYLKTLGYDVKLLIGADKLSELEHGWMYVDKIAGEFGIVCLSRGEDNAKQLIENDAYLSTLSQYITVVDGPDDMRDISSTTVRKCLAKHDRTALEKLVPGEIIQYLPC